MKKKVLIVICVTVAVLLIAGAGAYYYNWRGQQLEFDQPEDHISTSREDAYFEEIAMDWVVSLFEPYTDFFAPSGYRVKEYAVNSIELRDEVEDNAFIQIHFSFEAKQSAVFDLWPEIIHNEEGYVAEWVIELESLGVAGSARLWGVRQFMRPAAYDLMEYNGSGQREIDEHNQQFRAEGPWEPAAYPYKIQDGVVHVSYDAGNTWVETPLHVENLDHYVDGHEKTNALQEGSYQISPEKTVLMYGGGQTPLTCLWSDDKGQTWHTAEVAGAPEWIERKFVSFPDAQHGFLAIGWDKTMSWEACDIYSTSDGGATWEHVRNGPGTHPIASLVFFNENDGYLSYNNAHRGSIDVCRTTDGGVNWWIVEVEIPEELSPWFSRAGTPFWEGELLVLLVGENPMSDRSQKQDHYLRFISEDNGDSWVFDEEIQIVAWEPG